MSGIRPPDCSKLVKNPKNDNDVIIFRHDVNVKLFWRCFVSLVKFSYWSKFHINIITGSGVMTISFIISFMVSFIISFKSLPDWPEIRKSEIQPPEFCPISGDLGKLWTPNLAQMSLIKCYWMLQNAMVKAITVSELLREIPAGNPPTPRLGLIRLRIVFLFLLYLKTCSAN